MEVKNLVKNKNYIISFCPLVDYPLDCVLTEWDSEHGPIDMHLASIYEQSGWLATRYRESTLYDGSEGELYNMSEDPQQTVNLWTDPSSKGIRDDLVDLLEARLPKTRSPRLERQAPV